MMQRLCLSLLCGLLLPGPISAKDLAREDFAYGFTVEPAGEGAILELNLPEEVYRRVTRPDLGDLRVFNQAGDTIPHALRRPKAETAEAPEPVALPFFPVYARAEEAHGGRALRIITDEKGSILDATSEAIASDETDRVSAYLVDATGLERAPEQLRLGWEHEVWTGFAVTVDVQYSDDLSRWHTLVHDASFADLRAGGAVLRHDEIELPERKLKYLRISWPYTLRDVRLTEIRAFFSPADKPLEKRWVRVAGVSDADNEDAYEFDSGGFWPVDRARLTFSTRNVVLQGSLASRAPNAERWNYRHMGTFYTLEHDGTQLESEQATFVTTSDRYWRFESKDLRSVSVDTPLTLELGWTPHVLTVVAQGDPPYTVAFGSAAAESAAESVESLLGSISGDQEAALVSSATASDMFTLGGIDKLKPPPPPLPWKEWLLWAVLVLGVAVLAWMVWRLLQKVGSPAD